MQQISSEPYISEKGPDYKHRSPQARLRELRGPTYDGPILTRPRTAGFPSTHPIPNHFSRLPYSKDLIRFAIAADLDPEVLLTFLNQRNHLVYNPESSNLGDRQNEIKLQLGFDQANHLMAVIDSDRTSSPSNPKKEGPRLGMKK